MAYWCKNCQVPVLGRICHRCGTKLRLSFPDKAVPVFKEEIELLNKLTGEDLNFEDCDLWTAHRCYYYQGEKIFKIEGGNLFERPKLKWLTSERKLKTGYFSKENLILANLPYLKELEYKAILFIQEIREKFSDSPLWTVAFSGGKDSAVVSHLVRKAFGTNEILHIFVDTTMELPPTYEYVEAFRRYYNVPLIKVQADKDFKEMWEKAGPPSRIHRWCCTIFKTGPYDNFLKQVAENGKKVMTFEGIRACESNIRAKYEMVHNPEKKVSSNIVVRPILYWSDLQLSSYILYDNIINNPCYKKGLRRIGCCICPFASDWSEMIINNIFSEMALPFIEVLFKYSEARKIKMQRDYIAKGQWKKRAGGIGLDDKILRLKSEECFKEKWVYFYTLSKEINGFFFELFKPFGEVRLIGKNGDMQTYLIISPSLTPLFLIEILDKNYIKLRIIGGKNQNKKMRLKKQFENQMAKFQNCILCGACASVCEQSAIKINEKYTIDAEKCRHCLKCVYVDDMGCTIADSLYIKSRREYSVRSI